VNWFLIFLENAKWFFLFFSFKIVTAPCPRVLGVKTEVQIGTFLSVFSSFREACATVNRFAFFRFEGYCGVFAAFIAFNLKLSFLGRVKSPLFACD